MKTIQIPDLVPEPKGKSPTPEQIKKGWEKFHHGDMISTPVIEAMLAEVEAALPYLRSRGEAYHLATRDTYQAMATLESYLRARKQKL